jgi:GNAT superfamily N-acetyltransferase
MELFVRPAGPADAEDVAEVQRLSWRDTYRGLLSPETLARAATAWDANHWRESLERTDDRAVSLVLEGRDVGIVGFGVVGPRRGGRAALLQGYAGEIYLLYLLPPAKGQGNGARLMAAMARVLRARGMNSALVWALAGNRPAIAFYRRLSGTIVTQTNRRFFGEPIIETALGWNDLAGLAGLRDAPRG